MSFTIHDGKLSEYFALRQYIPGHLEALLSGLSDPPSDVIFAALRPVFSDEVLSQILADIEPSSITNLQPDIRKLKVQYDDAIADFRDVVFTESLARQFVSYMRLAVVQDSKFLWVEEGDALPAPGFPPPTTAAEPAPASLGPCPHIGVRGTPCIKLEGHFDDCEFATAKPRYYPSETELKPDPRLRKAYDCTACKKNIVGLHHLYAHHIVAHDGKWGWYKLRTLIGDAAAKNLVEATTTRLIVPGTVVPTEAPKPEGFKPVVPFSKFETGVSVDLRDLPDGRYAYVEPGLEPTKANATFIIKRTIKRPYTRRGKFMWGRSTRAWVNIPVGVIELRKQVGDTKELIGEQYPGEDCYRGELGKIIEAIGQFPYPSMELYGKLIGACAYCGRSLTDPLSRLRGIGPDCWEEKHVPRLARAKVAARSYS